VFCYDLIFKGLAETAAHSFEVLALEKTSFKAAATALKD